MLNKNGNERKKSKGASYLKIHMAFWIWGEEILYRKYSGGKVSISGGKFSLYRIIPWGEFLYRKTFVGKIFYIENHPERMFSIQKTFLGTILWYLQCFWLFPGVAPFLLHVKRCNIWSFLFILYNFLFVLYNLRCVLYNFPFILYNFLFILYVSLFVLYNFHLYCIISYLHCKTFIYIV